MPGITSYDVLHFIMHNISDRLGKLMLVTELAPLGALLHYLPKNKVGY